MPLTQAELDAALDELRTFEVEVSRDAPLPQNRTAYDPIRGLPRTGFDFTLRELLHAIGSKTAALPASRQDDCLKASLLLTYTLDLEGDQVCFRPHPDSDLVTPQSQWIGIGMVCLLAHRYFDIPWDQLGSLPGPGLRFDYRGSGPTVDGIFESKGTRHRSNQSGQVEDGIGKKDAHHQRGDHFDVELIVSTFIGERGTTPRILIGDPDFDQLARIFDESDDRFFRLRHYARILQFVGMPQSAFRLNNYAKQYWRGGPVVSRTVIEEDEVEDLEILELGEHRYFGRWFDSVVPEHSRRYSAERYRSILRGTGERLHLRRVFQGMREDVYRAGFEGDPFSQQLLSRAEIERSLSTADRAASLFPDGTIQVFEQSENPPR